MSEPVTMADNQSLREYVERNIVPNQRSLWALCFPLKGNMRDDDVIGVFSPYGTVAEISFSNKYGFVRFTTKQSAVDAFVNLKDELDIRLPSEKLPGTNVRTRGTDTKKRKHLKNNSPKKNVNHAHHTDNFAMSVGHGQNSCSTRTYAIDRLECHLPGLEAHDHLSREHNKQGSDSSSSSSSSSSSYNSNPTQPYQNAAPGIVQMPDRLSIMPQLPCDSASNDSDEMPCLEDIDGMPEVNNYGYCIQTNSADKDCSLSQPSAQSHQQDYSHDNGHISRWVNGSDHVELPAKNQFEVSQKSYDFQVSDASPGPEIFELYVKNFPYGTPAHKLLEQFKAYGATSLKVVKDEPGKGTLALVQFPYYELAAEALTSLNGTCFDGRNLAIGFSKNTVSNEGPLRKSLKKLTIKVNFESDSGSGKTHKREVIIEEEDGFEGEHKPNELTLESRTTDHVQPRQRDRSKFVREHLHQHSSIHYENKCKSVPVIKQDIDSEVASDSSRSDYAKSSEVVGDGHQSQNGYGSDKSMKQGVVSSIGDCTASSHHYNSFEQDALLNGDQQCVTNKESFSPGIECFPATSKPTWVSPPRRRAPGFTSKKDLMATALQSDVSASVSASCQPIPAMMTRDILEKMMREVCPGHRPLTVNDMLPEIDVIVQYKENDTYFWGSVLNGHFKHRIEKLVRFTQEFTKISPGQPVAKNRGMVQYQGEWSRVWIYGGDKVKAQVMYIDYGNTETINFHDISGIPDKYWKLPPQAVPFRLEDPLQVNLVENETVHFSVSPTDGQDYIITVRI